MDNITQGIIGGWIMEKVVGEEPVQASRWQRNKALILGGLITNIPDLDIFVSKYVPHKDYMSEFLFHRGLSHSVFFNILVALLVGWICGKTDRYNRPWWRWAFASYLSILLGHLAIDAMTAYGGRYLLPFSSLTYSWNNIFVVDMFFTIPLIVLWIVYLFLNKKHTRKIWYIIGAIWIVIYPLFTVFAKHTAANAFDESLHQQGKAYGRMLTSPEPLQAFLWRGVVQSSAGYYEGYYSIFDADRSIDWKYIPNSTLLRNALSGSADVQKVEKRAQGRTSYTSEGGTGNVLIGVVKMGSILGWKSENIGMNSFTTFMIDTNGKIVGQGGRGRFLSGSFNDVWEQHWDRVWGIK